MAKDEAPGEDRDKESRPSPRMACPFCGSSKTQPFLHAGPAARQNMRCLDCGHQFKDPGLKR